jgi:replicative DNA helicase Mcm
MEKLGLLLACVGGVTKRNPIDKKLKRGLINLMYIGEPSTAKTTLGKFVTNYYPKSKYALCSSSSQAGLGLGLMKDKDTESWLISAGVLVQAHKSIAVLDEAEKTGDHPETLYSLDSVMESQELNINKVGFSITVPTETTVILICNPKLSRWDTRLSLKEQVPFNEVTLSRIDLKFAFMDIPNKERDNKINKRLYGGEKLKSPLSSEFLIKYLLYAKKIEPKLTKKTFQQLNKYYLDLREKSKQQEGILQITPRQFDTLIRLSEAFAKLRLSEEINIEDTKNSIKIFEYYLQTFAFDERTGMMDIDKAEGRTPVTTRNKISTMLNILKDLQARMKLVPKKDFEYACSTKFRPDEIEDWLKKAKTEGIIFEPKPNMFEIV